MQEQHAQEEMTTEDALADLAACKEQVKCSDDLKELQEHPTFKALFTERYLNDEAARFTSLLVPSLSSTSRIDTEMVNARLMGISAFRDYVISIHQMADQARTQIAQLEAALAEHQSND